jgi:hypothetical protein
MMMVPMTGKRRIWRTGWRFLDIGDASKPDCRGSGDTLYVDLPHTPHETTHNIN